MLEQVDARLVYVSFCFDRSSKRQSGFDMAPPAAAVVNAALPGLSTVYCHFVTDSVYYSADLLN